MIEKPVTADLIFPRKPPHRVPRSRRAFGASLRKGCGAASKADEPVWPFKNPRLTVDKSGHGGYMTTPVVPTGGRRHVEENLETTSGDGRCCRVVPLFMQLASQIGLDPRMTVKKTTDWCGLMSCGV